MRKIPLLALTTLALYAACGSDEKTSDFVGTWTYNSGAITGVCSGQTIPVDLTGDQVTIVEGTESDLVLQAGTNCQIRFDVDGNVATAPGGQTCTFNVTSVGDVPVTATSWTLTLEGGLITSAVSGTATASFLGQPVDCSASGSGVLAKSSADAGTSGGDAATGN